jgi:putative transposase
MYLWRAVDDEGEVLDLVMQRHRDSAAALKLLKRLLRNQPVEPAVIVTDRLKSYGAALAKLGLSHIHHNGKKRENNRAENSHLPIRRRNDSSRASSPRPLPSGFSPPTLLYTTPSTQPGT